MITRRAAAQLLASTAAAAALGAGPAAAAEKEVDVGIDLSLTGADADSAVRMRDGAQLAFDNANDAGSIPGYKLRVVVYDDGTATAGQYDPAQAATNARRMVSNPKMVAAIGPQMSGAGKAMAPILSEGDLAIITPSSTNPDITNPKFAAQFRPAGQGDLFPYRDDRCLPGPQHGEFLR